jgi:hypothetical protein
MLYKHQGRCYVKAINNIFKRVRQATTSKLFVLFAVFLALSIGGLVSATSLSSTSKVDAAYCGDPSQNSIIPCGEATRTDFINAVKKSSDLQHIYAKFGLTSADYNRFITSSQAGVAYSYSSKYGDNTIVVDGKVVATEASSIGRWKSFQGSNPKSFPISNAGNGGEFWGNLNTQSFAKQTTAIPVDVLFYNSGPNVGQVEFAVMTGSCANPTYQNVTKPTYACEDLQDTQSTTNKNTYTFTTAANAGHGATITKLVYNFGDGSTQTTYSPSTKVTHTFTKNSEVSVTVYVSLPGGTTIELTNCKKAITFTPPPATYACTLLDLTPGAVDPTTGSTSYTLTTHATATHATIKSYTFNFGDGSAAKTVTTSSTTASVTHPYAVGTYKAVGSVTVLTDTNKTETVSSPNCAKPVTVPPLPATYACNLLTLTPGTVDQTTGAQKYTLTAQASAKNATIKSYTFTPGSGITPITVTTGATTSNTTYTYKPGTYSASVSVTVLTDTNKTETVSSPNCAKPVTVPPLPAVVACVSLNAVGGDIDSMTGAQAYTLTAQASAKNATIKSYTFTIGDGSAAKTVTTSSTTASTTHTYLPGTWNASVSVTAVGNGKTVTTTAPACAQQITVKPPVSALSCVSLEDTPGVLNADNDQSYSFTATASTDNASITGYSFNFGDGSAATAVTSTSTTATTTHTYAPGTYTATVTVTGKDASGNVINAPENVNCSKPITVQQPASPNITITKTVDGMKQEQVAVGQHFVYQLIVTNTGQVNLVNAIVTDTPPTGVTLLSTDTGTIANNAWTYTIPSLAIGQSFTVNITADVSTYIAASLVNTACVSSAQVTPQQPTSNAACSTATVTVTPPVVPTTPTPTVLVNTGAGNVIGIFGGATILGTFAYRLFLGRRLNRQG